MVLLYFRISASFVINSAVYTFLWDGQVETEDRGRDVRGLRYPGKVEPRKGLPRRNEGDGDAVARGRGGGGRGGVGDGEHTSRSELHTQAQVLL